MTTMANLDYNTRWTMREDIGATGAEIIDYNGDAMIAALPNPASDAIAAIEAKGYAVGDLWYFPLGSDKPADHLRHALAKYGMDNRGFWLYASVRLAR